MTESQDRDAQILSMVSQFIDVANRLKDEKNPIELVNTALMLASCTYATYLAAGNEGYLKEGGVRKIAQAYEQNLQKLQELRKRQFNPDGEE